MKRIFLGIAALLLSWANVYAQDLDINSLFSEANEYFREANEIAREDLTKADQLYTKALLRFERIVRDGGVQNSKLYYNIGNAYFRTKDLGRAILNYRRAERLSPNDPNVKQNLSFARSQRQDKIEEKEQTKVLKTLLFWHYDFSPYTRSLVFAGFFMAFWVIASIRIFAERTAPRWLLICLFLGGALFFSSLLSQHLSDTRDRFGVLLTKEVTARKGDGESFEPSFKEPLHSGAEFRLIEERGNWFHVELSDGQDCWLPAQTVELI